MDKSLNEIAQDLKVSPKKVQLIYAFNGTGKTRLSREFKELLAAEIDAEDGAEESELSSKNILYYNAFTEDLFYWDNDLDGDEERKLKIHPNAFTKWVLEDQGQGPTIIDYFQRLTSSSIEPVFSPDFSDITFRIPGSDEDLPIKISKGEESNFIWSVFYSFLELIIDELGSAEDDRDESFNGLKYVFIDDPVSSLDDNHLIDLAVELAKLVKKSTYFEGNGLKFILTTHSPLFYNVLHNELSSDLENPNPDGAQRWLYKRGQSEKYLLEKKGNDVFALTKSNDRPFSYHLFLLSELRMAIHNNDIRKYHFNFLRNILEKTATFLGHGRWEILLPKLADGSPDPFANRILNLSSHSAHAGEEIAIIDDSDKDKLEALVSFLSSEYKFWKPEAQND
ncbi:TPA: AAA family ATPase [Photobacterium damselae]